MVKVWTFGSWLQSFSHVTGNERGIDIDGLSNYYLSSMDHSSACN